MPKDNARSKPDYLVQRSVLEDIQKKESGDSKDSGDSEIQEIHPRKSSISSSKEPIVLTFYIRPKC